MDNVTLFKKIFSDERWAKAYRTHLDINARFPKLKCTTEDLKKYSFKRESLTSMQNLLCACDPVRPDIAKSAYDCLKRNESDEFALLKCDNEVKALRQNVGGVLDKFEQDQLQVEQIITACPDTVKEFASNTTDETAANFHACFMPKFCTSQLKRALNCVNKNHEELHGCETEIDEMMKCSIDKWAQFTVKISNASYDKKQRDRNNSDE